MAEPKIIEFGGPLYRANERWTAPGRSMRNLYSLNKPTFFLNDSSYLGQYIADYKSGHLGSLNNSDIYPKRFNIKEGFVLLLLDMKDVNTVKWVLSHAMPAEEGALRRSFKMMSNNSIQRLSNSLVKNDDDVSLAAICRIIKTTGIDADGYYTAAQLNNEGDVQFHPEVGLCPDAFHKLILTGLEGKMERRQERLGRKRSRAVAASRFSFEPESPRLGRSLLLSNLADNTANNNMGLFSPPAFKRARTNNYGNTKPVAKGLSFNNIGGGCGCLAGGKRKRIARTRSHHSAVAKTRKAKQN